MNVATYSPSKIQIGNQHWFTLDFGRYAGKSLPQVMFTNPDWVFWAVENDVFKRYPSLLSQVKDIAMKATRIKVPQSGDEILVVEHYVHRPTKKYSHFNLVPISTPLHPGPSQAYRQDVIDLSFARQICPNDKTGNRNIVWSLKQAYSRDKPTRMNRERCDAFFSSSGHFDA